MRAVLVDANGIVWMSFAALSPPHFVSGMPKATPNIFSMRNRL